jgi:hypothetical protein
MRHSLTLVVVPRALRPIYGTGAFHTGIICMPGTTALALPRYHAEVYSWKADTGRRVDRPTRTLLYRYVNEVEADAEVLDPDEVKAHATADDPWATAWLKRKIARAKSFVETIEVYRSLQASFLRRKSVRGYSWGAGGGVR